jgi:antitoxin component of RelBE/YafQ-DinJ toxin-antitoxin module
MITLTITLDKPLKARIRAAAKQKNLTMSAFVRLLLDDAVLPRTTGKGCVCK